MGFGEYFLRICTKHNVLKRSFGVLFHIVLDDFPSDIGADAAGGVVSEHAGERRLAHQLADNLFILGVDHVFIHQVLPNISFVFFNPGILVSAIADNILWGFVRKHGLGEKQFLPLVEHIVESGH